MLPWATVAEVRERVPALPGAVTDDTLVRAIAVASEVLGGLTGLRPAGTVTVEPVPCWPGSGFVGPYPRVDLGAAGTAGPSPYWWRSAGSVLLDDGVCGCELVLPADPVRSVVSVTVDGVLVDPATYRLAGSNRLRRLSGPSWHAGRTAVTYTTGALGEAALLAVAHLAAELAKLAAGEKCGLPARVQSVVRQGVTVTAPDPALFLDAGRTGLYYVDLFLTSRSRRAPRSSVTTPDSPRFQQQR